MPLCQASRFDMSRVVGVSRGVLAAPHSIMTSSAVSSTAGVVLARAADRSRDFHPSSSKPSAEPPAAPAADAGGGAIDDRVGTRSREHAGARMPWCICWRVCGIWVWKRGDEADGRRCRGCRVGAKGEAWVREAGDAERMADDDDDAAGEPGGGKNEW